jgi:molybdate transport system substrate-binding protein
MTTLDVLCAGATKAAMMDFSAWFAQRSDIGLNFTFGPVGQLKERILSGAGGQVYVLSRPALQSLSEAGRVQPETIVDVGTVGVGVAVRKGAAVPDVSSADALRRALLDAQSICYGDPAHGDSSGIHFASVIDRLGIREAVEPKLVLAPMGLEVVRMVASGDVQLGATQSAVILANPGVALAGLLPDPLQHLTTYAAGLAVAAGDAAHQVLKSLMSDEARPLFERAGLHM